MKKWDDSYLYGIAVFFVPKDLGKTLGKVLKNIELRGF